MLSPFVHLSNRDRVRKSLIRLKVNGFLKVQQKIRFPFREYFDKTTTAIFISQIFSRAVFSQNLGIYCNFSRANPARSSALCNSSVSLNLILKRVSCGSHLSRVILQIGTTATFGHVSVTV